MGTAEPCPVALSPVRVLEFRTRFSNDALEAQLTHNHLFAQGSRSGYLGSIQQRCSFAAHPRGKQGRGPGSLHWSPTRAPGTPADLISSPPGARTPPASLAGHHQGQRDSQGAGTHAANPQPESCRSPGSCWWCCCCCCPPPLRAALIRSGPFRPRATATAARLFGRLRRAARRGTRGMRAPAAGGPRTHARARRGGPSALCQRGRRGGGAGRDDIMRKCRPGAASPAAGGKEAPSEAPGATAAAARSPPPTPTPGSAAAGSGAGGGPSAQHRRRAASSAAPGPRASPGRRCPGSGCGAVRAARSAAQAGGRERRKSRCRRRCRAGR